MAAGSGIPKSNPIDELYGKYSVAVNAIYKAMSVLEDNQGCTCGDNIRILRRSLEELGILTYTKDKVRQYDKIIKEN